MSRIGNSIDTESKLVVASGWREVGTEWLLPVGKRELDYRIT